MAFGSVDVVLDSLAGEFVDASLSLLGEGGRFVEIGKADVRDPDAVAAAHPGVAYRAFDLLEAGAGSAAGACSSRSSSASPMAPTATCRSRPGTCAARPEAFRHHARGQARRQDRADDSRQRSERAGTVLITGGTGGLGALVARHLAGAHGVRRLVLSSRRGPEAEGAAALIAELAELGCEAQAIACDIADRGQVEALLSDLPLTGVVHAAGVLDDGIDHLAGRRADASRHGAEGRRRAAPA